MSDRRGRPRSQSREREPRYRSPPGDDIRKRPREGEPYDRSRGGFDRRDGGRENGGGYDRRDGGRENGGGYDRRDGGRENVGGYDRDRDRDRYGDRGGGGRDFGGRDGGRGGGRDFGGRDGGRGRGGGRDFGGRDGGRFGGGGRGGPGGRGPKKPHMGEMEEITRLVSTSPELSDKACLAVIDPPRQDRNREDKLPPIPGQKEQAQFWMPALEPWRVSLDVGVRLDNATQIVRSNYFRVNTTKLPKIIYHYNVSIYRYSRDLQIGTDDLSKENERESNTGLIKAVIDHHPEFQLVPHTNEKIGLAYDGKSSLYATHPLPYSGEHFQQDIVHPPGGKTTFSVLISLAGNIEPPQKASDWKGIVDQKTLQALDIALLSFARWQMDEPKPSWVISGNKAFRSDGTTYEFSAAYLGRLGYMASLKCCMSGLLLVSDVSVSCFLKGGNLVTLMAAIGGFRDSEDLHRACNPSNPKGLPGGVIQTIEDTLKSCRLRMVHLGHSKKLKGYGPAASSSDSAFVDEGGNSVTVAQYFEHMAESNATYKKHLPGGRLTYPNLPCVQVGSKNKPIYVPAELLEVIPGQSRQKNLPGDIAGNIIRYAAMVPHDRFAKLSIESQSNGIFHALANDHNAQGFGLDGIETTPMKVQGVILPPPKLQYGNRVIEPGLKGAWNLAGNVTFAHPAALDRVSGSRNHLYGLVVAYQRSMPNNIQHLVGEFQDQLEKDSKIVGIPLECVSRPVIEEGRADRLQRVFEDLRGQGAKLIVVLLHSDVYPCVKLTGDGMLLPTQCIAWKNVVKPPRNYHTSVLIKINGKLGGVNHTLASRVPTASLRREEVEESFQQPPKSISWLFEDEPCMVVGVDAIHPDISSTASAFGGQPVAAVVGSMDGKLGQYCAHVSAVKGDPVSNLERGMAALLNTFCQRNDGRMPRRLLIYRDGVADNQFEQVLEKELMAFKAAIMARGYSESYVRIAIIMCQKRHHARFVYQTPEKLGGDYANPCVGLCIDAKNVYSTSKSVLDTEEPDSVGNVNSPGLNEFYLISHAAVLGTSKPCKYTVIYDEIGLKLGEVELLTFWITHLYCRCTRSVSYATPAYYAHWAARRGKVLLNAGAKEDELAEICENWMTADRNASLYFV